MTRIFKILYGVLVLGIVLGLFAGALVYYLAMRSIPNYDRQFTVSGLDGTIEIVRDNKAIPHIFAQTDKDVFYGLGFAHAQDRLWQMTLSRRQATGRLSEIFGRETLDTDILMRSLDLSGLARQSLSVQDDYTRSALQSYSDGVNAWIRTVQTEALGRGAPEFFLFKPQIEPWTPQDSITLLKLLAVQSSDDIADEILYARSLIELGPELTQSLLQNDPSNVKIELDDFSKFSLPAESSKHAKLNPLSPLPERGFSGASNIWAAHPKRTAAKASLFANDPHVGLSAPSKFYLARLDLTDGSVIGATMPGIPILLSGRSDSFGWGIAGSGADVADLFLEELNELNSTYRTANGSSELRTEKRIIRIDGAQPLTVDLQWAGDRPILPQSFPNLSDITPRGNQMSLAHTALGSSDTSLSAWMRLMRSNSIRDVDEFSALFKAPNLNLIAVDPQNIAFQNIGDLPNRNENQNGQGRLPSQSWFENNSWIEGANVNSIKVTNPVGGILANTNNKISDENYPNHVAHEWDGSFRMLRLEALLNGRRIHTRESFQEAQLDEISFAARTVLSLIAKELWFSTKSATTGSLEKTKEDALGLLANWNGEMSEHTPEPLIFTAWLYQLNKLVLQDELGVLGDAFKRPDPAFIERVYRNIDGAGIWCDIRPTTKVETCTEISERALEVALIELTEEFGDRPNSWRWGDVHQAYHKHEILGDSPFLSWIVNIQQSSSGGDHTINRGRMRFDGDNRYFNQHAAGFRTLIDFSDPESSLFIASTGQSGHPLSKHYDDLSTLWRRGEYIPMSLDPEIARAGASGITLISPPTSPE